eukprot:gene4122-4813_t
MGKDSKTFRFIDSFNVPFAIHDRIERYQHRDSKITVILHHCAGPKLNASIVVPTESINDKGLPHTLEHLVFEGCDEVPYRDFIEVMSNRCFSAPSNAYTCDDHTCYSVESVGPDGIIAYLPALLNFVFTPTLKPSDFVTEIYHIDGLGQEQGVVLCEMQARENTLEDLQEANLVSALYKGSNYANSSGGLCAEISALTNEEIREYHGRFYHPEFVTIVIQGCIDNDSLFDMLDKHTFARSPFHPVNEPLPPVPWLTPIPPLAETFSKTVQFPSEDESVGLVSCSWQGPDISDVFTLTALSVLFRYFNGNSSSPFSQRFVHIANPMASNISFTVQEIKTTKLVMDFAGVQVNYKKDGDASNSHKAVATNGQHQPDKLIKQDDEQDKTDDNQSESESESDEEDGDEEEGSQD